MGYDKIIDRSLKFMSEAFCINELADNKRPRDGEPYIIVDESTDTMTIFSLFFDAYTVVPNVSMANLTAELLRVYDKEIISLKDMFMSIVKRYMRDFEDFKIHCDVADDGLFCLFVEVNDLSAKRCFWEKIKITLGDLARVNNINALTHDLSASIHSALLGNIESFKIQ